MTNPKIEKIKADIERTKAKIAEYQAKLREQERDKTRLENEQIVALVRGERISDAQLTALMASLRKDTPPEAGTVSEKQSRLEDSSDAKTEN
jgi:hypothetical protein